MARRTKPYLLLFLTIFLFACAPVISEGTRGRIDSSLTFKEVVQSPDTYTGKTVLWGGEIVQTLPQNDGSTLIEVLKWPLSWTERPRRTVSFEGKFLVLSKEPLAPSLYREGAKITIAGEIQGSMPGEMIKFVSDPTYRYPLLLSEEIHVRRHTPYPYSSVPDNRATREYREYGGILRY